MPPLKVNSPAQLVLGLLPGLRVLQVVRWRCKLVSARWQVGSGWGGGWGRLGPAVTAAQQRGPAHSHKLATEAATPLGRDLQLSIDRGCNRAERG